MRRASRAALRPNNSSECAVRVSRARGDVRRVRVSTPRRARGARGPRLPSHHIKTNTRFPNKLSRDACPFFLICFIFRTQALNLVNASFQCLHPSYTQLMWLYFFT